MEISQTNQKRLFLGLMRSIQFSISSYSQFSSGTQFVVCLIDMSVFMAHNNAFIGSLHVLWFSKYHVENLLWIIKGQWIIYSQLTNQKFIYL